MRVSIEIDDGLLADAQAASGLPTKKATIESALRLLVELRRQRDAGRAFGEFPWRGDLAKSREGRGVG